MMADYLNFVMRLQESLHIHALPEDKTKHELARRRTVNDLSQAVEQIVAHLKPELVLEIGAHRAEFSRAVKKKIPSSRVIAFEANPTVYERFKAELANTEVEYVFQCVADENKTYRFAVPGKDREQLTMGSVLNYKPVGTYASYDVEGKRLDDFLGQNIASNAMWVDVEGAVGSVLGGAEKTLKECVLFFAELEAMPRWDGQILDKQVIEILAGYGLYPALRDIQRHRWQHNVLFLREEALSDTVILNICSDFLKNTISHVRSEAADRTKAAAAAAIAAR